MRHHLRVGAVITAAAIASSFLILVAAPPASAAPGPVPVLTAYVPMNENDYMEALRSIDTGAPNPIGTVARTTISITSSASGAVIYYDQWENGFEGTINDPTQTTGGGRTLVWGDGITTNGDVGTFCPRCALAGTDTIPAGGVITLNNSLLPDGTGTIANQPGPVTTPRVNTSFYWDGRDKIASTRALTVSQAGWGQADALASGAVSAFDTSRWGNQYVIPLGQDSSFISSSNPTEYTALTVMARLAGTNVWIDGNADGDYLDAADRDVILGEGETVFVDGGILEGATILSSKPVQADLFVGDVDADYEVSALELVPSGQQANSYLIPAASYTANFETVVYLYNPNNATLAVTRQTSSGSTVFNVPANASLPIELDAPLGGAALLTAAQPFFTEALIGASSGNGGSSDDSARYDWGFAPVPTSFLTPTVVVGWAPGSQDFSDADASAVWVTTQSAGTTLYVDYDGDPTTGANFYPATTVCSASERYDVAIPISALESRRITDSDADMTGARITTCDFAKRISAAYGEDPANAAAGFPGLDLGTAIFPSSSLINAKSVAIVVDVDNDGDADPGDTLEWKIDLSGGGATPLTNAVLADPLPAGVTYQTGTTTVDTGSGQVPLLDNSVPPSTTAYPLDESGIALGSIAPGATATIRFRTLIDNPFTLSPAMVTNTACGTSDQSDTCGVGQIPVELPAGISDRVWSDADADGIQDAGETTGVNGVTVNLYLDANNDGTPDGGVISTTTTAGGGLYSFTGLDPTPNYVVEFVKPASSPFSPANVGANDAVDSDANTTTGRTGTIALTPGIVRTDVDAGLQPPATISDFVWNDADRDGIQDVGEAGINGVTVRLYVSTDLVTPIATTTTTGGGLYAFTNLDPSVDYVVEFVAPGGRAFSPADQGGNDNVDSDANVSTGRTTTINPTAGQVITNIDAGLQPPSIAIDKTSDAGTDVAPGDTLTYTIVVSNPSPSSLTNIAVTDTLPPGLTWQSTSVSAPVSTVSGTYGDTFESNGYAGSTGTIAWTGNWTEANDSGTAPVQDTGDVRNVSDLSSRRLYFQKGNDSGLESISRVAGNLSSYEGVTLSYDWRCNSMEAGDVMNVQVRPDGAAAWQTVAQYGVAACTTAAYAPASFTLATGQWGTATEVRFIQTGTWGGGSNDEFWADNVTLTVSDRANQVSAGSAPPNLATLANLLAGESATITVVTLVDDPLSTSISDFHNTATADPDEVPPVSDDVTDPTAPGVISNFVWTDTDGDGIQDGGEVGVDGVTVELYDSTGTTLLQTTATAGGGLYAFTVPAGTYTVKFIAPLGSVLTAPNRGGNDNLDSDANPFSGFTGTISVASAQIRTDIDAGVTPPGSIGDMVYVDLDGDGTQDPGETTGVANVELDLTYDLDGDGTCDTAVLSTDTTDSGGIYGFSNLPPGTWCVDLDDSTIPPGASVSSTDPQSHALTPGETYLALDFGVVLPAVISDRVWVDADADGIQDAGESGLPGVTVNLYASDGTTLLQTDTTDGSGLYSFTVQPGTYVVEFEQPGGYSRSPVDVGADDAVDSDASLATGKTGGITVASGQTRTDVDAGMYDPSMLGSIGDTIFFDANGNNAPDPGEGLAGVDVTVVWAGPDGNLATPGDNQTTTVTTGAGGLYLADLLPAGLYSVTVDTADLPAGLTVNSVDPNGGGDSTATLTLSAGEDNLAQDFGYVGAGSIGDTIFHDVDDDGSPDPGEGLSGVDVTVVWAGPDGNLATAGDNVSWTTTTAVGGLYLVSGLPDGTFSVTVDTADVPPALTINSVDPDGGSDSTSTLTLSLGGSNLAQDFGYRRPNSPPVPVIDNVSICANTPIAIPLTANDTDADLDTITVLSVSTSAAGRTVGLVGNTANYSPPSNFSGVEVFTYTVTDGYGATATGKVTVTVGSCGLVANDRMYFFGLGGDIGPGQGAGYYDQLVSPSAVRLTNQQLVIRLRDGFVPTPGDTFDIWTGPSFTGAFAKVYGQVLPNRVVLEVQVLPDRIRLVAKRGHFVTSAADAVDANPGDGTCLTAADECTLRAAVQEANALTGPDGIVALTRQTTTLALPGADEEAAATGDLDITGDTTIVGQSAVVDAADLDRGIHVRPGAVLSMGNLTVRNGTAVGAIQGAGALFVDNATATLNDVELRDSTGMIGGGLGTVGGTTTLNRGKITGNSAIYGGGAAAFGGTLLDAVVIESNSASLSGGGIGVSPFGQITTREVQVRTNTAQSGAGMVVFAGGTATIDRSTFSGNTATTQGGGISSAGTLVMTDSRVTANGAANGAGIEATGTSTVDRVTLDANVASVQGGGIQNGGTIGLTAVTITGNTAPSGAAIAQVAGSATLLSVTAVQQSATGPGGAALLDTTGTPLTVTNSIVSDNVVGVACAAPSGGIASGGYNHIGDASCAFAGTGDVNSGSAVLGPLAVYGGYSPTFKPAAGSPVINAGAPSGCGAKDQRNYPRPRGGACEKGAIEL